MKPSSARANFVVVPILVGISGIQNVPGWLPPAKSKTIRHAAPVPQEGGEDDGPSDAEINLETVPVRRISRT